MTSNLNSMKINLNLMRMLIMMKNLQMKNMMMMKMLIRNNRKNFRSNVQEYLKMVNYVLIIMNKKYVYVQLSLNNNSV